MKSQPITIYCAGFDDDELQTMLHQLYPAAIFVGELAPQETVDWVICHFDLAYQNDLVRTLLLYKSYIKPDGLFFCTHFGPDTLKEWDESSSLVSPKRLDMHDLGDLFLKCGFKDPVIDVDYFYTRHRSKVTYVEELKASNMLLQDSTINDVPNNLPELITTYEVIFAHGFQQDDNDFITKIPVTEIKKNFKEKKC